MKIKQLLLSILLPAFAFGQNQTFIIKGTIKNYVPGEKIYLTRVGKGLDSVVITNGNFEFTGPAVTSNEPEENFTLDDAILHLPHGSTSFNFSKITVRSPGDFRIIYIEPGITNIQVNDSVRTAVIKPPLKNKGHYELDSIFNAFYSKKFKMMSQTFANKALSPKEQLDYINNQSNVFTAEEERGKWQFVKNHPTSPVSLYILKHELDNDYYPDYDKIAPYYDPLSPELKQTKFGQEYGKMLAGLKNKRIGIKAPDFILADTSGKPLSLSSLRGKYVLVDFWASWCGPCRQENPNIVRAYNQFKDKNFTILGVSLDQKRDAWVAAIAKDKLDWAQVSDLKFWNSAAAQLYSVKAIPQNILLDPDGRIIAKNLFGNDLILKLTDVLSDKK